jgi:hypothetical protein
MQAALAAYGWSTCWHVALASAAKHALLEHVPQAKCVLMLGIWLLATPDRISRCRYKAAYRTSELLCRKTLRWVAATPALLKQLDDHDGTLHLAALQSPNSTLDPPIPPWSLDEGPDTPAGAPACDGGPSRPVAEINADAGGGVVSRKGKGEFGVGSMLATLGESVLSIDSWSELLSSSLAAKLREIAAEFLEYVGPRFVKVTVLDLG